MEGRMTTNKPTAIINFLTAALVFLLAAGAFVLSYNNLWETALTYGLPSRLAWIWPLLVDFALIVFSLAVVRASLHNEWTWWPWTLVAVYTVSTVAFNILHAPANLTAQIVAVVAPLSLFLSFETLMSMLKSGVRKAGVVQSIAEKAAELAELEGLYQGRQDKLESELSNLERAKLEAIGQKEKELTSQIGQLETKEARLTEEIEAKAKALETYGQDIEAKREELKSLEGGQVKIYVPANLSIEQRRELVNRMANEGMTNEAISLALGCSVGTIKNDKQANRQIADPVNIPLLEGGKNGHRNGKG
jgi:hypothetical protein